MIFFFFCADLADFDNQVEILVPASTETFATHNYHFFLFVCTRWSGPVYTILSPFAFVEGTTAERPPPLSLPPPGGNPTEILKKEPHFLFKIFI